MKYYTEMIGKNPAWTLADIYSDEGISGTSTGKREDFNRLIADCKRGKIDRVLTKSVSRFARNTVDCLNTVRLLSSLGVSILFEKEQIDTCKMSSEILLAMARRTGKRKVKEIGTKTESGKYSSKYALTDLLICGRCGSPYRRCTWSRNGKKKIVWRCINRLDYGKKYCTDSPSIEENILQKAVAEGIRQVVMDESGQTALEALKLHIGMYFGLSDENSTAADEIRMQELVQSITELAGADDSDNRMAALIDELNTVKQTIAEKRAKQSSAKQNQRRIDEILMALDALKNHPIEYDN